MSPICLLIGVPARPGNFQGGATLFSRRRGVFRSTIFGQGGRGQRWSSFLTGSGRFDVSIFQIFSLEKSVSTDVHLGDGG